ncbi:MAG TPA: hypothetical protein VJN39_05445, partial [Gemmatimonadales bacterium]|nr:hypothetical protein [Gemmatimonadales bacterium]
YDFSEATLTELARAEARAGHTDNALALLSLNAEFYPASASIALAQGDVHRQLGDTAAAVESYRAALTRDSTLRVARQRLTELTGPRR